MGREGGPSPEEMGLTPEEIEVPNTGDKVEKNKGEDDKKNTKELKEEHPEYDPNAPIPDNAIKWEVKCGRCGKWGHKSNECPSVNSEFGGPESNKIKP